MCYILSKKGIGRTCLTESIHDSLYLRKSDDFPLYEENSSGIKLGASLGDDLMLTITVLVSRASCSEVFKNAISLLLARLWAWPFHPSRPLTMEE